MVSIKITEKTKEIKINYHLIFSFHRCVNLEWRSMAEGVIKTPEIKQGTDLSVDVKQIKLTRMS